MAVHGPLPTQQHPPAPRAAFPAVPQALPACHRLPAAAAESAEVREPQGQGPHPAVGQTLRGEGKSTQCVALQWQKLQPMPATDGESGCSWRD